MKNIFEKIDVEHFILRLQKLTPNTKGLWGQMTVDQMLAHCNVTYELVFEDKHPKPNALKKLMLKLFVKQIVVNKKPYPKNGRTSPEFIIRGKQDFEFEKRRLIEFIEKCYKQGESAFDGKESHSFGKLTKNEWNNMFSKHLDHHLRQFGV